MRSWGRIARTLTLVVVLTGAACGGRADSPTFTVTVPGVAGSPPVPMVLTDRTGLVAALRWYDPEPGELPVEVTNPRGDLETLAVKWLGLGCDRSISARVERSDDGRIRIGVAVDRSANCLLAGVQRAVLLELTGPMPAGRVIFEEGDL